MPAVAGRSAAPAGPVSSWIFVGLLQAAVGYIQYFNDVPALLVGFHVAGATALWAMTVWLVLSTTAVANAPAWLLASGPERQYRAAST